MKVYYEAGLKKLAIASGHRAETSKSISNFKRTHNFLTRMGSFFFLEVIKYVLKILIMMIMLRRELKFLVRIFIISL